MKFLIVIAVALFVALMPQTGLRAQVPPPPTPSPNPLTYIDEAMNFTAPDNAYLAARRFPKVDQLGEELQPVAVWVVDPGKDNMRTITLSMESFESAPNQWESQFESQTHNAGGNGVLIRNKQPMSLLNGMPATFVEITSGSGFDSKKQYAIVWADGERGIVLAVTARLGDSSPDEAKKFLHNVTATRYPSNQP
ncbi:MAG TPA: hypothetical protein VGF18_04035 [Candidatus Tumulicola sp.]|jgi:hypothetical protein